MCLLRLLTSCFHHLVKTSWTLCSGQRLNHEADDVNISGFYHTFYSLLSTSVSFDIIEQGASKIVKNTSTDGEVMAKIKVACFFFWDTVYV